MCSCMCGCVCACTGYRAAGDAALLQQLCGQAGLPVAVVEMVGAATPGSVGPVSSTKVSRLLVVWQ